MRSARIAVPLLLFALLAGAFLAVGPIGSGSTAPAVVVAYGDGEIDWP